MKKTLRLAIMLSLLGFGKAYASEPAGTRIQALGGAGVALPGEAAAIYWNPAVIFSQDRIAADVTFQFNDLAWPGNWGFSYLNYSRSLRRGAGLGIYRMRIASEADSLPGGNAVAALLTTIYRTPLGIPLGLSFKYINENWAGEGRKNYFSGDVGTMMQLAALTFGVSFQSVTQPKSQIFPYRVLFGASISWKEKATLTSQAAFHTWDDLMYFEHETDFGIGLEVRLISVIAAQAGWREAPGDKYWTGGFSLGSKEGDGQLHLGYHGYPSGNQNDRLFVSYSYCP